MKKTIIFIGVLSLINGCGEEKGGKKRRIFFPKNQQELEQEVKPIQRSIRVASLRAEKLEVKLQREGLLDTRSLRKGRSRFLREKILGQVFKNVYFQEDKRNLVIDPSDELKFFPNEVSFETKSIANEAITNSLSKTGSWAFDMKIGWSGLKKKDLLTDVLVSLGSFNKKNQQVGSYGTDLIKKENALAFEFNGDSGLSSFKLNYDEIPLSLMNSITQPNSKIFFEIKDFKINGIGMKDFYSKNIKEKTRLIISLPYGEKLYWLKNGDSLEDFLRRLDPVMELNYDHTLLSFLGHLQDEAISYPDRNILNDVSIDESLSYWWTNKSVEISKIKADGSTIVLSYFNLKGLRESQEVWTPLNFKFDKSFDLSEKSQSSIRGKIEKYSIKYDYETSEKQIPFEIGTEVCMEDNRFERKADCSIHWKAAFSYPIANFRKQIIKPIVKRRIEKKEVLVLSRKREKEPKNGWLEIDRITNEELRVKEEPLNKVGGGFVGWKIYDSRLNNYKVRAPFDSLASFEILNGYENKYEFNGWKREFPAKY